MTLSIDGTDVQYLFVDDVEMQQAYVDGVLVFTGPELGVVEDYNLNSQSNSDWRGYHFPSPVGDLIPKEFKGKFIDIMAEHKIELDFRVSIDTLLDTLEQDFFWSLGILDLGVEIHTEDAVFINDGTFAVWKWPFFLGLITSNYDVTMYEREPFEFVRTFDLLPGTAANGASVGYTSVKYQNDVFGDLDPSTFKVATWGVMLESVADGTFLVGFEDVDLVQDYWREIHFMDLDITLYAVDGTFSQDPSGTFWSFPAANLGLVSGINYKLRIKGKQETLYRTEYTMTAGTADGSPGDPFNGFARQGALSIGSLDPTKLKGQTIRFIMDESDNRFAVGIGSVDLPQGYWHSINIQPGNITLKAIDFLFNNEVDNPEVNTNVWTHPTAEIGFVAGQTYTIQLFADNVILAASLGERFDYNLTVSKEDDVVDVNVSGKLYKNVEILAMRVYEKSGVFGITMAGENKLQSYWKEMWIPELDYRIKSHDMQYDRTSFKETLLWYTYTNLPQFVDGQSYTVYLYA